MEEKPPLGEQQLDLLRFVTDHAPLSVSEVAKRYGEPKGLARTTVLTMMETLRKKGYLTRSKENAAYRYSPRIPQNEVLRGLVRNFVERTLGGSLAPFVAYLAEAKHLSDEEIALLQRRVEELDRHRVEESKEDDA